MAAASDFVRAAALLSLLAAPAGAAAPAAPDWSKAGVVGVTLSDFAFTPNRLMLRRAMPVRLLLINRGSGGHSFSAPGFFATAIFRAGSAPPADGTIQLAKGAQVEVDLVPQRAGNYPVECTHFLHALFGMAGAIEVVE